MYAAMTGANRSPSSPWTRDSQPFPSAGSLTPTSILPICDSRPSPLKEDPHTQSLSPGRLSPGYFGVHSHQLNLKQGFHHVVPQKASEDTSDSNNGFPWPGQLRRSESMPGGDPSWSPPLKPQPQHLGQPARNHKMTVFWKENQSHLDGSVGTSSSSAAVTSSPPPLQRAEMPMPYLAGPSTPRSVSTPLVAQPSYRNGPTPNLTTKSGSIISPERCAELLQSPRGGVMLLDVRPYAHFSESSIKESLNLCIPTTLLKRRSFDTQKLAATFTDEADKGAFSKWKNCQCIIVYDASTSEIRDAAPLLNVLNKFTVEGWAGEGLILRGGFKAFSDSFPDLVRLGQSRAAAPLTGQPFSLATGARSVAPVVGGCTLPKSSTTAIPFFSNIRQNTDLVGGVGQLMPKLPDRLTESRRQRLPEWLRLASDPEDKGHRISVKFLDLEKRELERMKEALAYDKSVESVSTGATRKRFRIAGIEKGAKNRYNDIYPFDHSRVRLQDVPTGSCDYINASSIKAGQGSKSYIATQAPVPATFSDFWSMVWEQDVRVLVSLTAEAERGQVKCHRYWETGDYGPFHVENFAERHIHLSSARKDGPQTNDGDNNPCITVRHLALSHSALPFRPLREITQLQYPYWPDFGTTSQPSHLLELIGRCREAERAANDRATTSGETVLGPAPMLVHCSAGCGRTGTFCTVDSVLDLLRQSRASGSLSQQGSTTEERDLIADTLEEFRTQRPSMIQNLSQFVLCYESVLEWVTSQMVEGSHMER